MTVVSTATPAGRPSRIATSAGPCDSPAVIQRSTIGFSQTPRWAVGSPGQHHGRVDESAGWRMDPIMLRPVLTDRRIVEATLAEANPADRLFLLPLLGRVDEAMDEARELLATEPV